LVVVGQSDSITSRKFILLDIRFGPTEIEINLASILPKNGMVQNLDFVEDQLALKYQQQCIWFTATDGENTQAPALEAWLQRLQSALHIPNDKIWFKSVVPCAEQWNWQPVPLAAFKDVHKYVDPDSMNRNLSKAKFVGVLAASRFSVYRMRMIYELGKTFAGQTYVTHRADHSSKQLEVAADYYTNEQSWLDHTVFHTDKVININGQNNILNYVNATKAYQHIWNQFKIEVITETDEYQHTWFTDKTAKCLATGKPFLLLGAQHSLQTLKSMGFVTFDQWIDESYDNCILATQRIMAMIQSLKTLADHADRDAILDQMQTHAEKNIELYRNYVKHH
jgi:hypothetical protein